MSSFESLVRSATVGLGARPLDREALPPRIARTLSHPADGDALPRGGAGRDAALALDAAAAYALVHRVGIESAATTAVTLPSSSRQPVPDRLSSLLSTLMADAGQHSLLCAVLRFVRDRGMAVAPRQAAALLGGHIRRGYDELILGVMDERAAAALADHPKWGVYARRAALCGGPFDRDAWDDGDCLGRLFCYRRLRAQDPRLSREFLTPETLRKQAADRRAEFVWAIGTGLSPADEPLLEKALEDSKENVRKAATVMLCRLDGSALVRQAEDAVRRHVTVERGPMRQTRIACTPLEPGEIDARYWLDASLGVPRQFEPTAGRLMKAMICVPTGRWKGLIGITASEMLQAQAAYDGEPMDLEWTLGRAAWNWHDAALAAELFARDPTNVEMVALMEERRREEILLDALESGDTPRISDMARHMPEAWSPRLSLAVARTIARHAPTGRSQTASAHQARAFHNLSGLLAALPTACAPEAVPEALAALDSIAVEGQSAHRLDAAVKGLALRASFLTIVDQETT